MIKYPGIARTALGNFLRATCLTLALLAGPTLRSAEESAPTRPATADSIAVLRDVDLRLVRLIANGTEVPLPDKHPLMMRFTQPGTIVGRSSVNRFFSTYTLAEGGRISWPRTGLGLSRMAGTGPAMQLESRFTTALVGTTRLLTSTNSVRFQDAGGSCALEFVR